MSTRSTITGSSAMKAYSGSYNYGDPLGPSGEKVYGNGTVMTYNSVQVASGSFTFSIDSNGYTWSGSGHGTLTVTTSGICSGRTTFPYTFQILDATHFPGQNFTVFVGTPTPANITVSLTCKVTPDQASANGFALLSTYLNEFVFVSAPVTLSQHLTGNISYWYTIHSP